MAYGSVEDWTTWCELQGGENIVCIDRGDTEVFVAKFGLVVVIAFRGTQPGHLTDWLTDLKSRKTGFAFGRVHRGFKAAADRVFEPLLGIINYIDTPGTKIYITGHSKGAAEATITAASLRAMGKRVDGLFTFGSPRVGNNEFSRRLEGFMPYGIERYCNNNDIVCRVPFRAVWLKYLPFGWFISQLFAGYRHVGTLHYITSEGEIIVNPTRRQLIRDRIKGRWLAGKRWMIDGSLDHLDWEAYIGALR